ncbi:hypothetical protein ACFPTY_01060 [Halomonas beimenensis]|uniref:Uncharacterized protein n=1 Tax=Halomonas beimenensis TaxID=475662 RepID=A0A291P3S1_9GAMM|nr:hypothetical protein [Halomonas beimenensis]ATJ81543.1 hypothetical protein BEI_0556 [Halomonas beimenensis]
MTATTRHLVLGICLMGVALGVSANELTGVYCGRDGSDILVVDDRGERVGLTFSSWQGGGHHCGKGRLTATRRGEAYEVTDGSCSLTLSRDAAAITLAATPYDACKRQYCGARAALEAMSLPLSSRRPLPAPFEQISIMETPLCR